MTFPAQRKFRSIYKLASPNMRHRYGESAALSIEENHPASVSKSINQTNPSHLSGKSSNPKGDRDVENALNQECTNGTPSKAGKVTDLIKKMRETRKSQFVTLIPNWHYEFYSLLMSGYPICWSFSADMVAIANGKKILQPTP